MSRNNQGQLTSVAPAHRALLFAHVRTGDGFKTSVDLDEKNPRIDWLRRPVLDDGDPARAS